MTFEDVKRKRENPTAEDCDNKELQKLIDLALEKQIPQKPLWDDNVPHSKCPVCNQVIAPYIDSPKTPYCYWCGQKLDWGVQNDR